MYDFETISAIDVLQEYVDKVATEHWKSDTSCPPKFWVLLFNDLSGQNIMLTIDHHGYKFSKVIFLYDSLFSDIELLYNKTM